MPPSRVKSSGGRPTAGRVREISDRILAETGKAFARSGGRLSLDDIASDAQISKQAIYRRYSGKSALIKAVIDHALDAILVSEDRPVPADPVAALRHWAWRLFVNNSASNSADFSRHLQGMMMESDEIRAAVDNWESQLLRRMEAALRALPGADAHRYDPPTAAMLLYDIIVTGSRRVSDACHDRPVTDADRLQYFEPRWQMFGAMLGL